MIDSYLIDQGFQKIQLNRNAVGQFILTMHYDDKPYNVILDTGASSTVLDIEVVRALNISLKQAVFAGGGLGTSQARVYQLPDKNIKIGALSIRNVQPFAMDITHVNQALAEMNIDRVDGMVGSDILTTYHAIINYKSSNLYLLHA